MKNTDHERAMILDSLSPRLVVRSRDDHRLRSPVTRLDPGIKAINGWVPPVDRPSLGVRRLDQ
jgi:hypothetical protein